VSSRRSKRSWRSPLADRPLTERQTWALRYASRHGQWRIGGRGGMAVARGLEGRGLARVTFDYGGNKLVLTQAGWRYVQEHRLSLT
jgi:hypothetical protein